MSKRRDEVDEGDDDDDVVNKEQIVEIDLSSREKQVQDLLIQKNYAKALEVGLDQPPYNGNEEVKKKAAAIVQSILVASEPEKLLSSLNSESQDLLMKYIYKALESGQNTAPLFKWHKALVDIAGTGCIVRAMVDRKNVLALSK